MTTPAPPSAGPRRIEMPRPTAWPLVLSVGVALVGTGLATDVALSLAGAVILLVGLGGWINDLLPGRGHMEEAIDLASRPQAIQGMPGTVRRLREGMPGYRLRLPEKVHPISAGIRGGIVGGLVMPIPALLYGVLSGHGPWFPINLLSGMVIPGVDDMTVAQLEQFSLAGLVIGTVIHAILSLGIGLIYGVLLPTMPRLPGGPIIWGGILMPLIWTAASYGLMGVINPVLEQHVNWPWFILSQVVFGVAAAIVVIRSETVRVPPAGSGVEPQRPGEAPGE